MWNTYDIVRTAAAALQAEDAHYALEQAFRGIDALSEVELHPVLLEGFAQAGYGVLTEVPYPLEWRGKRPRKRALPDESQRLRCDVVLTPRAGQRLADTLHAAREAAEAAARAAKAARRAGNTGGLFEAVAAGERPERGEGEDVAPEDAFWLEIKVCGQYCYTQGVPGPNRAYSSELVRGLSADLGKLAADPALVHAGALLVLFTADEAVARNDLNEMLRRILARHSVRSPTIERFATTERIGNGVCSVVLVEPTPRFGPG